MRYSLSSVLVLVVFDFIMDYLFFYRNRDFFYILNINLSAISLWNISLVVLSFLLFGYILTVLGLNTRDERKKVDIYILRTVEVTDALRYNLYSVKIALKNVKEDIHNRDKIIDSIDEGLTLSINLIDSYVDEVK